MGFGIYRHASACVARRLELLEGFFDQAFVVFLRHVPLQELRGDADRDDRRPPAGSAAARASFRARSAARRCAPVPAASVRAFSFISSRNRSASERLRETISAASLRACASSFADSTWMPSSSCFAFRASSSALRIDCWRLSSAVEQRPPGELREQRHAGSET